MGYKWSLTSNLWASVWSWSRIACTFCHVVGSTPRIPALSYVLSLLALKLTSTRRVSHV